MTRQMFDISSSHTTSHKQSTTFIQLHRLKMGHLSSAQAGTLTVRTPSMRTLYIAD